MQHMFGKECHVTFETEHFGSTANLQSLIVGIGVTQQGSVDVLLQEGIGRALPEDCKTPHNQSTDWV